MAKPVTVLYFDDSLERVAALTSVEGVVTALGSEFCDVVPLLQATWESTLQTLDPNAIYFLCSHGGIGEDGTLQLWLEKNGFRHTHSSAQTCALLFDKHSAKLFYETLKIPTPSWTLDRPPVVESGKDGDVVVAKPRRGGSKRGITTLSRLGTELTEPYLYEQLIEGTAEVSVAVIRIADQIIAMPPILRARDTSKIGIVNDTNQPPQLAEAILQKCKDYAVTVFESARCYGITKTDFVIGHTDAVWAIETDVLPGLGIHNAVVRAARQQGIEYEELVRIILTNLFIP